MLTGLPRACCGHLLADSGFGMRTSDIDFCLRSDVKTQLTVGGGGRRFPPVAHRTKTPRQVLERARKALVDAGFVEVRSLVLFTK